MRFDFRAFARLFAFCLLLALLTPVARAADVAVKAPSGLAGLVSSTGPYTGKGWYIGAASEVGSAHAGTTSINAGDVSATSGAVGLRGGYMWGFGRWWTAVDGFFGWQNLNSGGLGISGPASFSQRFIVGGQLSDIMSLLPSLGAIAVPSLPQLAPGQVVTNTHLYMFGSFDETDVSANFGLGSRRQWLFAPGFGIGAMSRLSSGSVIDVYAKYVTPTSGFCLGPASQECAGLAQRYVIGLGIYF
jgi:hypothetical protein